MVADADVCTPSSSTRLTQVKILRRPNHQGMHERRKSLVASELVVEVGETGKRLAEITIGTSDGSIRHVVALNHFREERTFMSLDLHHNVQCVACPSLYFLETTATSAYLLLSALCIFILLTTNKI